MLWTQNKEILDIKLCHRLAICCH